MATVNESTSASLDAAASIETTYTMAVGDTFNGILDHKFDEDWVKIELEKGKTYQINLSGRGKDGDEAEDTILKLFDYKGNHIVTNDDIDTANRVYDSELIYTATATGTYYISASSYTSNPTQDNSGAYTLMVAEHDGRTASGADITGSNSSERLTGTNEAEVIRGLGGNDSLYGRGGDDVLDGGPGNDTLIGGPGADDLIGGSGNDTASYAGSRAGVTVRLHDLAPRGGDAQGDTFSETVTYTYREKGVRLQAELPDIENLTGSSYNDILAGDQRPNKLSGGSGNDTLYGGPGGDYRNADTMRGGPGNDHVFGGRGDDTLYGDSGADTLRGGPDEDTLYGGTGDDTLDGGNDDDILEGGSGSDKLYGGDGDDILDGGYGDDVLEGGDGSDIFRFSRNDGDDDIKGFDTSRRDGDRIDLTDFEDIDSMDDLDIKQRGSDTRIDLDAFDGGEIWLLDFDKDDLDDADFIFYKDRDDDDDDRDDDRDDRDDDRDDRDDGRDDDDRPPPGNPNDDIYYGTRGNDSRNTGAGEDLLYGLAGDDGLWGGAGVDSYEGGPGNDIIRVDSADIYVDPDDPKLTGPEAREADEIDGGENPGRTGDSDAVSFEDWQEASGATGVTVALATQTVTHGIFGAKANAFKNIENLIGSRYEDTLTGDDRDNVIEGGADSDTLDGSGGSDTVSYQGSNEGVIVSLVAGATQSGGHASGDTLTGFENILGSRHADTLTGDDSNNVIEGGRGGDTLDGGAGSDTLSYRGSGGAVTIDLRAGNATAVFAGTTATLIRTSSGGDAGGDKVRAGTFDHIIGSRSGDRLTGDGGDNTLEGGPGADRLDGGDHDTNGDTASYAGAAAAVTVDLTESGRGRGDAAGDRFTSIEMYLGSAHDDTFIASDGADNINGGGGMDTVSYERSAAAVNVNLATALQADTTADSYAVGDTLTSIENLIGSRHDDTLAGDGVANVIEGGRGDDTLTGAGGDDVFKFASGDGDDHITDFASGYKIDLTAFTSIASLEDLLDDIDTQGGDTEIDLPGGGSITLDGYTTALTADDFIFYARSASRSTRGNDEANLLIGGAGNDTLRGRAGDDRLYGGAGDDRLYGDAGADILHGGTGSDTFFITYEADTVEDTVFGEGDNEPGEPAGEDPTSVDTLSYAEWVKPASDTTGDTGVTVTLGGAGTSVSANTGIENLIGSRYEDILTGDGNPNVIEGGADSDTLDGGGGSDTVSYQGSNAAVTIDLTSNPQSGGHAAGDTLTGFENILGSRHADTLTGDDSNNVIEGGRGGDTLDGGAGSDTLSYRGSGGAVTIDLRAGNATAVFAGTTATLIRTSSGGDAGGDKVRAGTFDHIIGSRSGDRLTGDGGDNTLEGGPGADRLDGGDHDTNGDTASYAGAAAAVTVDLTESGRGRGDAAGDRFTSIEMYLGSAHDDTFIASDGADNINGGGGMDTVSYERSAAAVNVNLATALQADTTADSYAVGDTLTSIENLIGSRHDDTLAGDGVANVIEGGRGDDTLTGAGGDDVFKFASGDGDDHITDFASGYKIDLTAFTSIASLEDLLDDIDTQGGDTEIDLPGGGSITLDGYTTALTADNFIFHETTINGTSGSNTLKGDARGNEMNAGAGNDQLFGNGGRDTLNGEAGDDTLYGGADNDALNGGEGDDLLDGGPGADTFVFAPGSGNDHIMDFQSGADRIDLSMFTSPDTSDAVAGDENYTIELPDGGTITLLGITAVDTGVDFIL